MAQEIVIRNLCDLCLAVDKETDADTYHVNVTITGEPDSPRPFVVELCGEHGSALANAVTSLVSYGRKPEKDAPAPSYNGGAARVNPTTGKVTCPQCGDEKANVGSLRYHARQEHGKSLAGVGFYPSNFTCPGCGDGFPNRQGMAAHMRVAHPNVKQSA